MRTRLRSAGFQKIVSVVIDKQIEEEGIGTRSKSEAQLRYTGGREWDPEYGGIPDYNS